MPAAISPPTFHAPRLLRSAALPLVVTAGLLLLALAVMLATTTRSLNRITPLQEHLDVMVRLHDQISYNFV